MNYNFSTDNYWLNIDKPLGYSSAKVVALVKKITKAKKVGHSGTLDPQATGVLPIAVNSATRTCKYVVTDEKKYYFEVSWGEFRSTDDAAGQVIQSSDKRPSSTEIIAILPQFVGEIFQRPPQFCALNIGGRRAYKLAARGQEFTLKPRPINIHSIKLIDNNHQRAAFEVRCGKGTYIRSLARDMAEQLGACGFVSNLRRLQVGNFLAQNIISLDKLKSIVHYARPAFGLLDLNDVLSSFVLIDLDVCDAAKIKHGQIIKLPKNCSHINDSTPVKFSHQSKIIGLGVVHQDSLKPISVF